MILADNKKIIIRIALGGHHRGEKPFSVLLRVNENDPYSAIKERDFTSLPLNNISNTQLGLLKPLIIERLVLPRISQHLSLCRQQWEKDK